MTLSAMLRAYKSVCLTHIRWGLIHTVKARNINLIDMFTLARTKFSVPINSLWISMDTLPETLQRYCAPAFFYNEDQPIFDLSARGTALLLRYHERNFAILTRHQLGKGVNALKSKDFTIGIDSTEGQKIGLTPNAVTHVVAPAEDNLEDLQICEYEDERSGRDLSPMFLKMDLKYSLDSVPKEAIKAIFLIGFPSELTEVTVPDWDEQCDEIPMTSRYKWVKLYLQHATTHRPLTPENRIMLEPHDSMQTTPTNPDGLSGAPVFFIWMDEENQAQLGLAGIITDARSDRYAVYSTVHIRSALEQCLKPNLGHSEYCSR